MCGIAGIYKLKNSISLSPNPRVLSILSHRGPDVQKYHCFQNAILYHTRLSILDLSEQSHQPFLLNENKGIVFNGEIFNYKTLAKHLNSIHTKGDTEVLIQYFDKYRIDGLHHLNGFFAFAFYDNLSNELYVVRDRYGEKPLYYYHDEDVFAFASEIHPLLELIQKKLSINYDVLYTYFRMHYIPGEQSILNGIKRLLPGYCIHIQQQNIRLIQWYNIQSTSSYTTNNFKDILIDAVWQRSISDAPIGAFLSGGIDSSIVCAIAKQQQKHLHTFSLGYKNEPMYDETADAEKIAKYIGSEHHTFHIDTEDMQSQLLPLLQTIDEPYADSSAINIYFLTQKIQSYAKVALSGDGADEILMGYHKHKIFLLQHYPLLKLMALIANPILSILPDIRTHKILNYIRKTKKFAQASQLSSLKQYIYLSQWAEDAYIHQLFQTKLNTQYFYSIFEKYRNLDLTRLFNTADIEIVLTNDMLYKIDFFGMQNAVEIRSPYLDYRVMEHIYHLPLADKIRASKQKYLLKKTFSDILPPYLFQKRKRGFEIPLHKILPHIIQQTHFLKKEWINTQQLFQYSSIEKLIKQMHKNNTDDASLKLWTILVFQVWYDKFQPYIKHSL